jgi:carbonic anhydrase
VKTVEIAYRYAAGARPRPRPRDAAAAHRRLDAGNRAFAALLDGLQGGRGVTRRVIPVDPGDLGLRPGDRGPPRQRPFAAVLGCADARVPTELIFGEGPNDLFVVRIAGNGLGPDALGSLKYAVDHLGDLKLAVVLGHSGCGALTSAVDLFLQPAAYLSLATSPELRGTLDRLLIVVQASARTLRQGFGPTVDRRPGYRAALIETAIVVNAALGAHTLVRALGGGGLRAAYGVYLIETRRVWAPRAGATRTVGLAGAPDGLAAFVALGDAVVRSERIVALLDAA